MCMSVLVRLGPIWSDLVIRVTHLTAHFFSAKFDKNRKQITSVSSFLIIGGGGHFPWILDLFQRLKIGVPSGCVGKP